MRTSMHKSLIGRRSILGLDFPVYEIKAWKILNY